MEILNERLDLKRIGQQFNVTAIMISWTRQPSIRSFGVLGSPMDELDYLKYRIRVYSMEITPNYGGFL